MSPEPQRSVSVWAYVEGPLRVLLLRRVPSRAPGWQPVTGRVEAVDGRGCAQPLHGSPLVAAAVRELREETGLPPPEAVVDLGLESEFVGYDGATYRQRSFAARYAKADAPRIDPAEHEEGRWTAVDEALALLRWDEDKTALRALVARLAGAGGQAPGTFK